MRCFDCDKLRNLRLLKGYSLEMTARLLKIRTGVKISRAAICNWEHGKAKPSVENLSGLSDLFEVPIDYFFTYDTNNLFGDDIKYANKYSMVPKNVEKGSSVTDGVR